MAPKKKVKKEFKSSHPDIDINKENSPDIDIKVRNLDKLGDCCSRGKDSCGSGCSHFWVFGSALAMILSYERSASILWAILHGALSWFYILFRAMQIWGWF